MRSWVGKEPEQRELVETKELQQLEQQLRKCRRTELRQPAEPALRLQAPDALRRGVRDRDHGLHDVNVALLRSR